MTLTFMRPPTRIGLMVYGALLAFYPRTFRREFAFDMIQDFEEASEEAWENTRWRGLVCLWLLTGADVIRSAPLQWVRSGTLVFSALAVISAASCAAVVEVVTPRVAFQVQPGSAEREGVLVLILVTTVVVLIAATVIFSLLFLRPVVNRNAGRRRV
jgi:hypothetical protein